MKASPAQIRVFYAILAKRGIMDMKQELVSEASSGRTTHSSELDRDELQELIDRLDTRTEHAVRSREEIARRANTMRRRILSMCYNIGWTRWEESKGRPVVDMVRLNSWMHKSSYAHKSLNKYTYNELPRLVSQFEAMVKTML